MIIYSIRQQKEAFKNIGQDDYTQADYDIDYPKASTSTSSESLDARNNAEADYYRSLIIDPEVGEEVNEGVRNLPDNYFSKYLKK